MTYPPNQGPRSSVRMPRFSPTAAKQPGSQRRSKPMGGRFCRDDDDRLHAGISGRISGIPTKRSPSASHWLLQQEAQGRGESPPPGPLRMVAPVVVAPVELVSVEALLAEQPPHF